MAVTTISLAQIPAVYRLQTFDENIEIVGTEFENLISNGYVPIETLIGSQSPEDDNVGLQLQVVDDPSGSYYIRLTGKYIKGWTDEIQYVSQFGSDLTEDPTIATSFDSVPLNQTVISALQDTSTQFKNTEYLIRVLFVKEGEESIIGEATLTHRVNNDFSLASRFLVSYYNPTITSGELDSRFPREAVQE